MGVSGCSAGCSTGCSATGPAAAGALSPFGGGGGSFICASFSGGISGSGSTGRQSSSFVSGVGAGGGHSICVRQSSTVFLKPSKPTLNCSSRLIPAGPVGGTVGSVGHGGSELLRSTLIFALTFRFNPALPTPKAEAGAVGGGGSRHRAGRRCRCRWRRGRARRGYRRGRW